MSTFNKKNIIYFIIIAIIAISTIFLFYKKDWLMTKFKIAPAVEQTATLIKPIEVIDNKEELMVDIDVLKSQKYQILRDNSVLLIEKKEDLGRRNPFERYK